MVLNVGVKIRIELDSKSRHYSLLEFYVFAVLMPLFLLPVLELGLPLFAIAKLSPLSLSLLTKLKTLPRSHTT